MMDRDAPVYDEEDDTWSFVEPQGHVPVNTRLILGFEAYDGMHSPEYHNDISMSAARMQAMRLRGAGVGGIVGCVLTSQRPVSASRCVWCRDASHMRHVTLTSVCSGYGRVCPRCWRTYCSLCSSHRCVPTFSGHQPEGIRIRNDGDFSDTCDRYRQCVFPHQLAARCRAMAHPAGDTCNHIKDALADARAVCKPCT